VAERVAGERAEALREFDGGLVCAAGEHGVFERIELIFEGCVDARIRVTEQVDPPGADRVQIAVVCAVVEPRALAARNRDERQAFMVLHLGAGVPDGTQAAGDPVFRGC
jgi:hypothetical protein